MSATTDPAKVKTLRDWVKRWPSNINLGFDSETREPTIYARTAPYTTVVGTIPWKREGDTMTILAQPGQFSEQAVAAARKRYDDFHDAVRLAEGAVDEELRTTEAELLAAWRAYREAGPAERPALRRAILTAERTLREQEAQRAPAARKLRAFGPAVGVGMYVEPLPLDRRALALEDI
jgi:hypothetical protein